MSDRPIDSLKRKPVYVSKEIMVKADVFARLLEVAKERKLTIDEAIELAFRDYINIFNVIQDLKKTQPEYSVVASGEHPFK